MAMAAAGDTIITPKLDRMFRSAIDALNVLGELKARGVSLHMIDLGGDVTGNGVSKLVFTILSAVAEAERDRIRERVRDVKRDQARRGRFLGGTRPPFGWRVEDPDAEDKRVVEDPAEQAIVAEMRALRGAGRSFGAIAAHVAEAHGRELQPRVIKRILDRDAEAAGQSEGTEEVGEQSRISVVGN